jgi:hypothetical protein
MKTLINLKIENPPIAIEQSPNHADDASFIGKDLNVITSLPIMPAKNDKSPNAIAEAKFILLLLWA